MVSLGRKNITPEYKKTNTFCRFTVSLRRKSKEKHRKSKEIDGLKLNPGHAAHATGTCCFVCMHSVLPPFRAVYLPV